LSDFDRDESGWRRGIAIATCAATRWVGAIDRRCSDPTVHGQWVDADLLGELPLVEPRVPELTNELIDLGLVAAPARALDVMHPSLSPDSEQIGNHGVHRTLTEEQLCGLGADGLDAMEPLIARVQEVGLEPIERLDARRNSKQIVRTLSQLNASQVGRIGMVPLEQEESESPVRYCPESRLRTLQKLGSKIHPKP